MKPILFNTEMTLATLENRKTQTRRLVNAGNHTVIRGGLFPGAIDGLKYGAELDNHGVLVAPYQPGDILYVREKYACDGFDGEEMVYVYWTEVDDCGRVVWGDLEESEWAPSSDYHWHPSIHMPKEAARIFLRVTDVRVEKIQEITDKGARAEGCGDPDVIYYNGALTCEFAKLWDSTIKPAKRELCGWAANPWVWVYEFERCEKPRTQ